MYVCGESVCACLQFIQIQFYDDDGDGAACWSDVIFLLFLRSLSLSLSAAHPLPHFEEFMIVDRSEGVSEALFMS